MKKKIPAVCAICLALLLAGVAQRADNRGAKATAVVRYTTPGTLPDTRREGYCWTRSIAAPYRADAWRCTEQNAIHDPCFRVPNKQAVVCGANPITHIDGFQLALTKPLPNAELPAMRRVPKNWAWLVQLDDGTVCTPFTGTRPFIRGQIGFYGCASDNNSEQIMILGDLNARQAVWTAKKAVLVKSGTEWVIKSTRVVPVKTIWQ